MKVIKYKILPKKGTYNSVLPYKSNGKFLFGLCHTCTELKQQTPCDHSDEQV